MSFREFPEDFLWGTATASFQIEMGLGEPSTESDWWVWIHDRENIKIQRMVQDFGSYTRKT
jgi:beta-glucosidase/6-phospho-beta-glucosidase/beta-galactosidase